MNIVKTIPQRKEIIISFRKLNMKRYARHVLFNKHLVARKFK